MKPFIPRFTLRFFQLLKVTSKHVSLCQSKTTEKKKSRNVKCTLNHSAKSAYLFRVTTRSVEQHIQLWHVWSFSQLKHRVNNAQWFPSEVQQRKIWKKMNNNLTVNYLFSLRALSSFHSSREKIWTYRFKILRDAGRLLFPYSPPPPAKASKSLSPRRLALSNCGGHKSTKSKFQLLLPNQNVS